MTDSADRLQKILSRFGDLAIAVSGGVDSMTLATFAHRLGRSHVLAIHAVSPAVPAHATKRVKELAVQENWELIVTGAGEFDDPRYRDNPVDRCYFCKTNLYDRIRVLTPHPIASGANLDDLGDYRPGLLAAAEREVVHPFIEAKISKSEIRALARQLGLGDIAELPAQPCLASRVETGIAISANDLAFIERTERRLSQLSAKPATLRCRIAREGVILELGDDALLLQSEMEAVVAELCAASGRHFAGARPYARGSMFIHP